MPELPEVETIKTDLAHKLIGLQITDVFIFDDRVIRNCRLKQFKKFIIGKIFKSVTRQGKAIIFKFDPFGFLIVQPMMTGQLIYQPGQELIDFSKKRPTTATKIIFQLSNRDCLLYNDQRLFGRLNVLLDLGTFEFFKSLGPDPLADSFTVDWLKHELKKRKTPIKTLLMNQNFIAGIGNIYASEILFGSGIHPLRRANELTAREVGVLYKITVQILNQAVLFRGTSMNTYRDGSGAKGQFISRIKVYGREREACMKCKTPIQRLSQAGRSTFFCQHCQPARVS